MPEESLLCRTASTGPETNFQSHNIESSVPHPLDVKHPCFLVNVTAKLFSLTAAPACNSQNHTAVTVPVYLHLSILVSVPTDLQAILDPSWQSCYGGLGLTQPASPPRDLRSASPASPQPCAWSSTTVPMFCVGLVRQCL